MCGSVESTYFTALRSNVTKSRRSHVEVAVRRSDVTRERVMGRVGQVWYNYGEFRATPASEAALGPTPEGAALHKG